VAASVTAADGASFRRVVLARYTAKQFDAKKRLPAGLLAELLALAARAPTSFNSQPYVRSLRPFAPNPPGCGRRYNLPGRPASRTVRH
jgi:hypothetical protein